MDIKELRISKGLTQKEVSAITGIPLRTYKNYENDERKKGSIKYNYIVSVLEKVGYIDEEHGILGIEDIKKACGMVFDEGYDVEYCRLFGSYARGEATESSDVDLVVSSDVTGLKYYGMVEALREALKKKVDVLDLKQLNDNPELLYDVLKEGLRIYERKGEQVLYREDDR